MLRDDIEVQRLYHQIITEDEQKWLRNYKWYMYEDNKEMTVQ